jgi:hypothetical protein
MTKKRDGAKDLQAYVTAVTKQGAKLIATTTPRTKKEARRKLATNRAIVKGSSN